jgi:lipopolysaccharide transport system permease protein
MYQPGPDGGIFTTLVRLNPVWPLMDSARDAAASLPLAHPQALGLVLGGSILATAAGFMIVRATAPIVIERMLLGGR